MKAVSFIHAPFELPGNIKTWCELKSIELQEYHIYKEDKFPNISDFDILVLMGGPMSVNDEKDYPFLKKEKAFIEKALKENKKVIGVCLGAQLIANVMGEKVYKNRFEEVGWFDIEKVEDHPIIRSFPNNLTVFHWHGETFDLPKNSTHLFRSKACKNQGFIKDNALGLQFHIEITKEIIDMWLKEGITDKKGEFIQSKEEVLNDLHNINKIEPLLYNLLESFLL